MCYFSAFADLADFTQTELALSYLHTESDGCSVQRQRQLLLSTQIAMFWTWSREYETLHEHYMNDINSLQDWP